LAPNVSDICAVNQVMIHIADPEPISRERFGDLTSVEPVERSGNSQSGLSKLKLHPHRLHTMDVAFQVPPTSRLSMLQCEAKSGTSCFRSKNKHHADWEA
jgi:hypothetical protein